MTPPNASGPNEPGGSRAAKPSADPARQQARTRPEDSPTRKPRAAETKGDRLLDAVTRPLAGARRRLARIVPEPGYRLASDEAAAFQAAEIAALRSAATVEPASPRPRSRPGTRSTPGPAGDLAGAVPATAHGAPGPELNVAAPGPVADAVPLPDAERPRAAWAPAPPPIVDRLEALLARAPEPPVSPPEELAGIPAEEQPAVAAEDVVGAPPVSSVRRRQGATALDRLLRSPESVGSAADDFFDGVVRRTTADR